MAGQFVACTLIEGIDYDDVDDPVYTHAEMEGRRLVYVNETTFLLTLWMTKVCMLLVYKYFT